jgi:hypothetical protein
MDDEVAHLGVVHGPLRQGLPGFVSFRVVGIDADDVERLEVSTSASDLSSPPNTRCNSCLEGRSAASAAAMVAISVEASEDETKRLIYSLA